MTVFFFFKNIVLYALNDDLITQGQLELECFNNENLLSVQQAELQDHSLTDRRDRKRKRE